MSECLSSFLTSPNCYILVFTHLICLFVESPAQRLRRLRRRKYMATKR